MIDHLTAQKIKDTADIVDVVGDYVHLIRRGANYMGLCPFHNERTPSFSVNRRKNFCYCFSCKKGGSPVNFIMEKEGLSYHDALLHLAKKYGIEVIEKDLTDEERAQQSKREAMLVANEWAMQYMENNLSATVEGQDIGLQYLYQRGVTDEAIKKFHLGYAIDKGNDLVEAAIKAGYDLDVLKDLGLIGTSAQGRDYDRFRGRVIFPIMNSAGKVIAFGGRDLKGGLAKYINSPESRLYVKSNELYGIYQARQDIIREDKCYLVEGYLDVIGMWQSGMKNVVASSGTALTDGQIAMIHRFSENITLIYDGDAAGIKASLRGIDMLLSHKMKVKVLLLPDGDDPDSFAKKHTPEEFREYVRSHETDIIRFKAEVLLSDAKDDPQKRINAINSIVESLAHIPDPVSRDVYVHECSHILNVSEETIAKTVSKFRWNLVEKWKREKNYPSEGNNNQPFLQNSSDERVNFEETKAGINDPSTSNTNPKDNKSIRESLQSPLAPLERKLIEYCVKYGYLDLNSNSGTDDQESCYVIDIIDYELQIDDIKFSLPIYERIFSLIKELREDFLKSKEELLRKLEQDIIKRREDGIQKIGMMDLTISEIEREEKKLESEINNISQNTLENFSKDYVARILASHEDDGIRFEINDLIKEKHQLSAIYTKDNNIVEKEEDKLDILVDRAVLELKSEILNQKLMSLFKKFQSISDYQISEEDKKEKEKQLQLEMNALMKMRSQLAKEIGERIVSPVIKKKKI